MTGALIFRLVLLALVALAWGWLATRIAAQLGTFEGSLAQRIGSWLRSPEDRRDRSTFLFLTFVLVAMLAMLILLPAG
ncbi:MAG: hypothetical protein ACOCYW_02985 [Roseicyclus sp.]